MKTPLSTRKGSEASILLVALCTMAIIGLALVGYLQLVFNQNQLVTRSQVWNICMPVLEAGIEEALAHCNANYKTNMVSNGWTLSGSTYALTNWMDDGYYEVTISTNLPYEIISTGYCPVAGKSGYSSRTVKVTTVNPGLFSTALVFLDSLDLKGNNVLVDSYDSTDPAKSTLGKYDPLKAGDKGDVSTKGGVKDDLKVGNANIWGHLTTSATAEVYVGPNGAVGDVAWQTGGNSGILTNWWSNNLNLTLPDIKAPFSAATPPGSGKVSGVSYNYILGNGSYMTAKLDGATIVTGNAVLYVTDLIKFGTSESVIIMPGASLTLYYAGIDAQFNTIVNKNSNPNTFQYYGLSSNTGVVGISDANDITGVFYAPHARVQLTGKATIFGAVAAAEAKLNGNASIHYDESLRNLGKIRGVFADSWREI